MLRFGLVGGLLSGLISGLIRVLEREVCFTPTVTRLATTGVKKADLFRDKQPGTDLIQ